MTIFSLILARRLILIVLFSPSPVKCHHLTSSWRLSQNLLVTAKMAKFILEKFALISLDTCRSQMAGLLKEEGDVTIAREGGGGGVGGLESIGYQDEDRCLLEDKVEEEDFI